MRAVIFALALLPVAAQAQTTTPADPAAPTVAQSCPAGASFDAATQSCVTSQPAAGGGTGCGLPPADFSVTS